MTITAKEMYELLQQLNTRVIVLFEKIDRIGPDHEERIRSLERSRWPLPTVATVLSLVTLGVLIWGMVVS